MIISHELRMIFIHVPRTGGTTITNLLQQHRGVRLQILSQHGNARTISDSIFEKYHDYFKFSFVRNPWERTLSWYALLNKHQASRSWEEKKGFEAFLESEISVARKRDSNDFFCLNQLDYLSLPSGKILVDRIGRFEKYKEEIRDILTPFGLKVNGIPSLNPSAHKPYQYYYTEKSYNLVEAHYQKDISFFGYKF